MIPPANVVIIGAGPAGLATALQLKRYGIDHLIVEKNTLGGLLINAHKINNYLGFDRGISGPDLVGLLRRHIEANGIEILYDEVTKLEYHENMLYASSREFIRECKIAVIASGTKPKMLEQYKGIEINKRIFYEVDKIRNVENKTIGIIGAGDAAFDYALTLSKNNKVMIFNRADEERCIFILRQSVDKNRNIKHLKQRALLKIEMMNDGLQVEMGIGGGSEIYSLDYLIFAVGREPELGFLDDSIKENMVNLVEQGRLFMVGDVKSGDSRQMAIACGHGVEAAMRINRMIRRERV